MPVTKPYEENAKGTDDAPRDGEAREEQAGTRYLENARRVLTDAVGSAFDFGAAAFDPAPNPARRKPAFAIMNRRDVLGMGLSMIAVGALLCSGAHGQGNAPQVKQTQPSSKQARLDAALFHAIDYGNLTLSRKLPEHGASPNAWQVTIPGSRRTRKHDRLHEEYSDIGDPTFAKTKMTPLIRAIYNGDITATRLLLKHGADVNMRDLSDWTPLMWAIGINSPVLIDLILARGPDVTVKSKDNFTAIELAGSNNNTKLIERLRKLGATK